MRQGRFGRTGLAPWPLLLPRCRIVGIYVIVGHVQRGHQFYVQLRPADGHWRYKMTAKMLRAGGVGFEIIAFGSDHADVESQTINGPYMHARMLVCCSRPAAHLPPVLIYILILLATFISILLLTLIFILALRKQSHQLIRPLPPTSLPAPRQASCPDSLS